MDKKDFLKAMSFLGVSYGKEFDDETLSVWYTFFTDVEIEDFKEAIKQLVVNKKFIPSIAEIIDECKKVKAKKVFGILELMKQDGYFKKGKFGDLDEVQQFKNLEKATLWLTTGRIPEWFKSDMESYKRMYQTKLLNENVGLLTYE